MKFVYFIILLCFLLIGCVEDRETNIKQPLFKTGDFICHKLTKQTGIIIYIYGYAVHSYKVRMYKDSAGGYFDASGSYILGIGGIDAHGETSNGYFEKEFEEFELEKCNKE